MDEEKILLGHGSGGSMTNRLIKEVFHSVFSNPVLDQMLDAAVLTLAGQKIAFTTDSFVVDPIFFPGGDIGKIAVCGTVNDLAVSGATPSFLSVGVILEEGFPVADLKRIAASMAAAAKQTGVVIVAGDTKVVERGGVDKIFINTSGIGLIPETVHLSPKNIRPGDAVILSGRLGEHGLAILAGREGLSFRTPVVSDCTGLQNLTQGILKFGERIRCMRDPTRGGVATALNEIAEQSGVGILIQETVLPIAAAVAAGCEMLGLDPLYLANEGKLIAIVDPACVEEVLASLRSNPEGANACVIGQVIDQPPGMVLAATEWGSRRILRMLEGEPLPRIC